MDISDYIFYFCSISAVLLSLYVVLSKDPVKSVLGLVGVFFLTAMNWLLLQAEFLAVILILVYIGAVMVLFLFVVMMVQESAVHEGETRWSFSIIGPLAIIACLVYSFQQELSVFRSIKQVSYVPIQDLSSILFSQYLIPFEVAGLVLLVSIVSAVSLTLHGPRNRKHQDESLQIGASKKNRLKVIRDMKP